MASTGNFHDAVDYRSFLEPVLRRAVNFSSRVHGEINAKGQHLVRDATIKLIKDGISISEDLEAAVSSISASSEPNLPSEHQRAVFNNMFTISTKTTEAIARSLYRTIKLQVIELVLGLVGSAEKDVIDISSELDLQLGSLDKTMILEQLCQEIKIVFEFNGKGQSQEGETGMAYRVLGMF